MRRRSRGDSRMKITLEKHPALNIEITDNAITTNLRELIGIPEEIKEIEDLKDEQYIQGVADTIESLFLALFKEGLELERNPAYANALQTLFDAVGNGMDGRTTPDLNSAYDDTKPSRGTTRPPITA